MSNVKDLFLSRLTDNYNKHENSNVNKLVELTTKHIQDNEDLLSKIGEWIDIDQAEGTTLDMHGRNVQQERGQASDDVYRVLIKSKIKRNLSDGSINTIIDFLSFILNINPSEVIINELWEEGINLKPLTLDFKNKISASTEDNPNIIKRAWSTVLENPNSTQFTERSTGTYGNYSVLDNAIDVLQTSNVGEMSQALISFDLIRGIEKSYGIIPGATTTDKVTWLKNNILSVTGSYWGFGSSSTGNKINFSAWHTTNNNWTTNTTYNTRSFIEKLEITLDGSLPNSIDVNGFVYFLAYSEPSNGTASVINSDYVNLEVKFKSTAELVTNTDKQYAGLHINVPGGALSATGLSISQFGKLVNTVTAAGVKANVLFEGTFSFSADYNNSELNSEHGFDGGTLGFTFDPSEDTELPI